MDLAEEAARSGRSMRILVTRLRYLGDVIMSTPAVAALKRRYPEGEIYYLAEDPHAAILEGNPDLTGVVALRRGLAGTLAARRRIRGLRPVAALDLFYNPRSAWFLYSCGIPVRVGGSRRWRRRLYTERFTVPPGVRSGVMHHLHAASALGAAAEDSMPRVFVSVEEAGRGAGIVRGLAGGGSAPVVAMHPGGTWPSKRWAAERFARLARLLEERIGARSCVVNGPGEEGIADRVVEEARGAAFPLPRLGVRELAAALSACDAMVANDGGVMHLSVGLGLPTVAVFGPTEPDIWFPYEGKGPFAVVSRNEECSPCHRHFCEEMSCLEGIVPDEVLARLLAVTGWSER